MGEEGITRGIPPVGQLIVRAPNYFLGMVVGITVTLLLCSGADVLRRTIEFES